MKIVIYGAGVLAQLTKESVAASGNDIAGMIDPLGKTEYKSLKNFDKECDIIIDFSHFSSLQDILEYAVKNKKPVVIATTGHSKEQLETIKKASEQIAILKATNTSFGVTVVNELLAKAAKILKDFDIEIIEKHHNRKIDSPSGTANTMIEVIQANIGEERKLVYGREGNSKRTEKEIGVHSVRAGNIVGEHSVIFSKDDEIIEIKHEALSRKMFADGAVNAALKLAGKKSGLYSMKDLLIV